MFRKRIESAFAEADVQFNGRRPWDITVHDDRLFRATALHGVIGFGEAYLNGWWDCQAIDQLYDRAMRADVLRHLRRHPRVIARWLKETLFNLQSRRGAARNVRRHYELGNDLFAATLDKRMTYSCGFWQRARNLDQAQQDKLELVCRKLGLQPGMRVLDIGCGWGSFAGYAAERYGCHVTGITLSSAQINYARNACDGLPVEIQRRDYRDVDQQFDRVVSIGMFEHVGDKNYRTFMRAAERALKPDGLFLLHFFATQRSWPNLLDTEVTWVSRHVFPGMVVPSLKQVGAAIDGVFVTEDLHNFGADYDPTLMAWHENFQRNWPTIADRYDERFRRLWSFYLQSCAGAFRCRKYQLWQLVFSPTGVPGGYQAVRTLDDAREQPPPVIETSTPAQAPTRSVSSASAAKR